MNTLFKTTALAFATSSLLLAGCGGSSSDSGSNNGQVATKGKVIDFYLDNANVNFEGCASSAATSSTGDFNIPAACAGTNITVTGGTDIGTELQNTVTLHALKVPRNDSGTVIVSPLTTLIYHTGTIASTAQIAQQLGLDANLLVVDPMTNAQLLKTTLVAQQLIIQVQAALQELGVANEATASEAVAKAVAMQMVKSIQNGATISDLSKTDFIQGVIETSVINAKSSLSPALQANINTVAKNVAAVSAGLIAQQVQKVNALDITIQGNPAATLAALKAGGQIAVIKAATQSEAAANAINAVADLLTTADPAKMKALGDALASGNRAAIEAAAGDLNLPQSAIDDLVNIEKYQDYIRLMGASFNGTPFDINRIRTSTASNPLLVNGFKTIQLDMTQVGQAPQSGVQQAKVGLSYTINSANTLNIVVNQVNLEFSTAGKLMKATIPAGTTYSVQTFGKVTTTFDAPNKTVDNLAVDSNGLLNLSVDEFLSKAQSKSAELKAVINDYTPKSGDALDIDVSLNLRVGIDANGTPADDTSVNAGGVNMVGKGVSAQLKIQ
ncbi:MAG: hypothetical protein EOO69_05920 [Moraxellaceae bacterium]|nr:MAG: hypothetical protein EOO69_05920 [Moraxellaceae bacterium]